MDTSVKKQTILIVEDEVSLQNALRDTLAREDFVVLGAKDGEEGLMIALSVHPDLILLDIVMPKMDGLTMLRALRKDVWGKDVHVIMLTNVSDTEKVAEAMTSEVFEYFVKSDSKLKEIVAKIKEKLGV